MKKLYLFLILLITTYALSCRPLKTTIIQTKFNQSQAIKDKKQKEFLETSAEEVSKKMITGWNLGNTLDATGKYDLSSETSWGCPYVTKESISSLKASGINTIRIPITWSNHIIDGNFSIDPLWMERVKQIVDYAIDEGMYVVINSHHDNLNSYEKQNKYGYYPNNNNLDISIMFISNIWSQICLAFNNGYDEHLLFEAMNEPRLAGTNMEWQSKEFDLICREGFECIAKLNQVFVDTVRKSGGNNKKRILIIPTLHAGVDSALCNSFSMPQDDTTGKLMISVHMYTPYSFAMEIPGETIFTEKHKKEISDNFQKLYDKYTQNGYPVFIGEYGATNKSNDEERIKWFEYFLTEAKKFGFVACVWDNYQFDPSTKEGERYGYYIRDKGIWYSNQILKTIIESTK